jgi:hypothetical protein
MNYIDRVAQSGEYYFAAMTVDKNVQLTAGNMDSVTKICLFLTLVIDIDFERIRGAVSIGLLRLLPRR